MGYEVKFKPKAEKGRDSIPSKYFKAVSDAVFGLENNPKPKNTKKLADSGLWRVRTGEYRIVYSIDDDAQVVMVVRVVRRSERTYKGLK